MRTRGRNRARHHLHARARQRKQSSRRNAVDHSVGAVGVGRNGVCGRSLAVGAASMRASRSGWAGRRRTMRAGSGTCGHA